MVCACGPATEGMSEIVDFFLQTYLPTIPSFIKDTDDFIRRILNIIDMPSDVLIATLDVMSLYPSIPHNFGLHALNDFLLDHNLPTKVDNEILNMTELVLKRNVFHSEYFTLSVSFKLLAQQSVLKWPQRMPTLICQYLKVIYKLAYETSH